MKNKLKFIRFPFKNIFSRLLFFNILLIIIATLLPQFAVYKYFINKYCEKLQETNYHNICQVRDFVDETIFEPLIGVAATHFSDRMSNDLLMQPISNPVQDDSYMLLQISTHLYNIQESYSFIQQLNVYYPYNQLLFCGDHVFFLDQAMNKEHLDNYLKYIINCEENLLWLPVSLPDTSCIYVRTIPYFNPASREKAVLAIEVKTDALVDAIEKTRISSSGYYGIVSPNGISIAESWAGQQEFVLPEDLLHSVVGYENGGFFRYRVQDMELIVSYADSQYNDWKYISVIPIDDVFSGLTNIKIWLLFICGVLILFNIIFAVFLTKRAHSPMEYILKKISGYASDYNLQIEKNQYHLLEETFHSLAFRVEDLEEHLEANKPIIYYNILQQLLYNPQVEYDPEMIHFKREMFIGFLVKIYFEKDLTPSNKMLAGYSINDLLCCDNEIYETYIIADTQNRLSGIINFNQQSDLDSIVKEIQNKLKSLLSVPFVLCLGSITDTVEKIPSSYQNALEKEKYAFFCPDRQIFGVDYLPGPDLMTSGFHEKDWKKVPEWICNQKWDKLENLVTHIISLLGQDIYTADYRKSILNDFLSVIHGAVVSSGYDETVLGDSQKTTLQSFYDLKEVYEWMIHLIHFLETIPKKCDSEVNIDWKQKIERYVEENIFHDLSLTKMSEDLGISSSYLSRIFKTVMGVNFSEYLIEKKLLKAKELLNTTSWNVQEISQKLGYSSTAHFIRIFKQRFGCTPKQSKRHNL